MKTIYKPNQDNLDTIYKILIESIVPRPIAWVTTQALDGTLNLAPFSFFTIASRNPATLMISIGEDTERPGRKIKDTLTNILATNKFSVSIVTESLASKMFNTAKTYASDINEFETSKLESEIGIDEDTVIVKESPISFELNLSKITVIGSDTIVFGEIKAIHIDSKYIDSKHRIDIDALKPLASLAGDFSVLKKTFKLK